MTTIVGGLRDRLIHDSIYWMIHNALDDLDWLAAGTAHRATQVHGEPLDQSDEIITNLVAISDENSDPLEAEMGSNLTEYRTEYWVDVYGEDAATAKHLGGDIRTILEGKMTAIGRSFPTLTVYDYTQATPPVLFTCQLENVSMNRSRFFERPHQKFWWMIRFEVVDHYMDDSV